MQIIFISTLITINHLVKLPFLVIRLWIFFCKKIIQSANLYKFDLSSVMHYLKPLLPC